MRFQEAALPENASKFQAGAEGPRTPKPGPKQSQRDSTCNQGTGSLAPNGVWGPRRQRGAGQSPALFILESKML